MKNCTLCGGKLDRNKRCTFCGLDNTKNDNMYKHAVNRNTCEEMPLTHVHEEVPEIKRVVKPQVSQVPQMQKTYADMASKKPVTKVNGKKAIGCAAFLTFIPAIITIIGIIVSIAGEFFVNDYDSINDIWEEEVYTEVDYSPYLWVSDEMPTYGESMEFVLTPGIYKVGCDIPMGNYEGEFLKEHWGSIELHDDWNEIDIFIYPDSEEEVFLSDLRLYDGAYFVVPTGTEVKMTTENAQPLTIGTRENELTEMVEISQVLYEGSDYEEGMYDIVFKPIEEEYVYFDLSIMPVDSIETYYITFETEMGEQVFRNVPLFEGSSLDFDEDVLYGIESFYLVPSEQVPEDGMTDFFDVYWY